MQRSLTPRSRLVTALVALLVWGLAAGLAAPARAEDVVVLALGGDATEAQRAPVLDAIAARFASDGFAVLGPAELVHRLPPSRLSPATTEDAARIAAELGVPRVACVSVWMSGESPGELALSLHALSGDRSVRHTSANGAITAEHDLAAVVDVMVAQVLAAERAAAMLDPGAGASSSTSYASSGATGTGSAGSGSTGTGSTGTGSTGAGSTGTGAALPPPSTGSPPGSGPEPLFGILGPGLLAAIGAAGIGLGVWASLDPTCDLWNAARTVCLRGEENNLGVGITMIITGALSLAGAVVWWVTDAATPPQEPRIDVVVGPGGASVRGVF